eukprot:11093148-Ditylum_brightwellii.AAC.1
MPPLVPWDAAGNLVREALEEQSELGWDKFIKGCVSKKWATAQYVYSQSSCGERNSMQTSGQQT